MTGWAQLEAHTVELNAAIETVTSYYRDEAGNVPQPLIPPDAPAEVHRARRPIMANIARLQTLLAGPTDFLQELARQVGLSLLFSDCAGPGPSHTRANGHRLRRTNYSPS